MMWLMYRPAGSAAVEPSRDDQNLDVQKNALFTEHELALLQARSKVAPKSSHSVSATEIEERAA